MRAKFVYESIKFERGRDPRASLDIGLSGEIKKKLKEFHRLWEEDWRDFPLKDIPYHTATYWDPDIEHLIIGAGSAGGPKRIINYLMKRTGLDEYFEKGSTKLVPSLVSLTQRSDPAYYTKYGPLDSYNNKYAYKPKPEYIDYFRDYYYREKY